jgi:hypothetical protein
VGPSNKALQRERDKLAAMTDSHQCHKPIPQLIAELNRQLKGWGNYFQFGRTSCRLWLANLAAGLAVGESGTVAVSREKLAKAMAGLRRR